MTENKRFKNVEEELDWGTIQYFTYDDEKITDNNLEKLVNQLLNENEELKQAYTQLKHRHSLLHDVCIDAECDRDSYRKDIVSLEKENEELKSIKCFADTHGINIFNIDEAFRRCWNDNGNLVKENVRLKEQLTDANELNQIYVDYLIDNGFELSDVIEWSKRS